MRILRIATTTAFLAFLLTVTATNTSAQNILGEILRRMDGHSKALQSLKADVSMVKFNPQLNVSDTYTGTTSYLPKTAKRVMYVRLDWLRPAEEQISVIGDNYQLFKKKTKLLYAGKVSKSKGGPSAGGALAFLHMSKQELNANYDVVYLGEEQISGGSQTWHLQLNPKKATSYRSAELWVDGNGMPLQAKILEHNGDTTTVLLSAIRKNDRIDPSLFRLDIPKGIKPTPL